MEHLPPVGWADVATKRDLDALEVRVDARFSELRVELYKELQTRWWRWDLTVGALVVAAVRFL